MKKIVLLMFCIVGMQAVSQNLMRVTMNNGSLVEFSVNNIKEMDFYVPEILNIVGEWITISGDDMICFNLKEDGTLIRKNFGMKTQFSYELDGTWALKEKVLTIDYSGTTFLIDIVSYTDSQIISTTNDVYYKVQEPIYNMSTLDNPINIGNEENLIKYVDNCIIGVVDNKVKALKDGSGYALVENVETGTITANRIDVLFVADSLIDWAQYLEKSEEYIIAEFGTSDQINDSKYTQTYVNYNSAIQFVTFAYEGDWDKVTRVQISFYDENKRKNYCDLIEKHYILNYESANSKIYYDAEDPNSANVKVTVYDASVMCAIVYTDLKTTPVSAVDWTQYFKKTGDQIKSEFGSNPDVTDDDEYEDYSMVYYGVNGLKSISFTFDKGFQNVTSIRISFNDSSSMQGYYDTIAAKYILDADSSSETLKVYYDTDSRSTASVRIRISTSVNYISYSDLSK